MADHVSPVAPPAANRIFVKAKFFCHFLKVFWTCARCWLLLIIRGRTVHTPQSYLAFRRSVEFDWNSDGNVGWFLYSAGDGIVSDIPAIDIPGRKQSDMMT